MAAHDRRPDAALVSLGVAALVGTLLVAAPVEALHEMDHRYDLKGYVLDASEHPKVAESVTIRSAGRTLGGGLTDSDGWFVVRLHLHDTDLGRPLEVRTSGASGAIRVQLTPGDARTERVHHVNFVGDRLVEGELPGRVRVPAWVWPFMGIAFLAVATAVTFKVRRIRRRRARAAAAQAGAGPKRAKRGRGRKR